MNLLISCTVALYALILPVSKDLVDPPPANQTYCNARFGYCIDYPDDQLTPLEEAQNGDGRKFENRKGEVVLTVFGRLNQDENGDPIKLHKQFLDDKSRLLKTPGTVITTAKEGKDHYILGGTSNKKIFYHKMIIKEDAFCFALLEYAKADSAIFNAYRNVIAKTFK